MEGEREDKGKFSGARNGSPVGRDCVNNTDPRALANVGWLPNRRRVPHETRPLRSIRVP